MESAEFIKCGSGYAGTISAWRNSAKHYAITAPDRFVRVIIRFSNLRREYYGEDGQPLHEFEAFYSPDAGYWRADVPPSAFPEGGLVLFKIVGMGTEGERKVLGSGFCRVYTGFTNDPSDAEDFPNSGNGG